MFESLRENGLERKRMDLNENPFLQLLQGCCWELCLLLRWQALKFFYMASSLVLVLSIFWLRQSWERRKDSCSLPVLCVLSVLLGTLNFLLDQPKPGSNFEVLLQYLWIISHYLQVFSEKSENWAF